MSFILQVFDSYIYEVMPYFDMLVHVLMIEDSWQSHRLHICLKGGQDDIDSLFDAILRYKNNCQKRAYLCIKMMVNLFTMWVFTFVIFFFVVIVFYIFNCRISNYFMGFLFCLFS